MNHDLSYGELYEKYLEMQFRVTRFSAMEQELINARDKLDHELVVYKRLNSFISKAIRYRSLNDLLALVAESVIDVFELQIGYVHFKSFDENGIAQDEFFCEGCSRSESQRLTIEFQNLEALNIFSGKMKEFTAEDLDLYLVNSPFEHCILSKKLIVGSHSHLTIGAAVDKKNAPNYNFSDQRKLALFGIFIQQVESLVNNLLTFEKNRDQMKVIRKSEIELRKLSLIATSTNNAVIISDQYGQIEWVNKSFEESTGYILEEVKGKKPKDFLQVKDSRTEGARAKMHDALSNKKPVEVEIINVDKQGNEYIIQLQISPVIDEGGEIVNFIALQKDITSEAIYRKELERINFRMAEITRGSSIGMWEYDIAERSAVWNDVLFRIYDVERSATNLHEIWTSSLHPEDREFVLANIRGMIEGEYSSTTLEYRVLVGKNLEVLKYVRTVAFIEQDQLEKRKRVLGSTIDITKTKNFENEIIEKNTELTKINGELDQFVYSVSHDLRAPLLSVKGLVSLIRIPEGDAETASYLELINKSINRLDGTILEILNYSRNSRLEIRDTKFSLIETVSAIFNDLSHLDPEVHLEMDLNGPEEITSDKFRIEILMKNLISNGIKYRRKSEKKPFVRVKVVNEPEQFSIQILDNGQGIPEKYQDKVFDMFYRASSDGQGTGLGLYLCKEIVNKLGGEIKLSSNVNLGTVINVTLPLKNHHA